MPGLTVWAEALDGAPSIDMEAVRRHDAVVREAWTRAPACLPVRFGQWLPGLPELEDSLAERRDALEQALARVAGAGEHGLRIAERERPTKPEEDEAPRPSSGRAYLERVREKVQAQDEHERRGAAVARALEALLEGAIRAQRVDPLPADRGLVSVSHLVSRERETEYARRVASFREAHPELDLLTTGPWPPYSFAP